MMTSNPNIAVQNFGQSFWYDNIQRAIIDNGELARLISDYGVLGVTSNPAIFEKAITGSADYDQQLEVLARQGAATQAIYEALAIADIQRAADLLKPVYDRTDGLDGYISLEVSPALAHDTQGTISEALRLHKAVGRKNLMVKVPATPEGIPAVEQLIADGLNINVTLIFSLAAYEQVARAYIAGLQRRATKNKSLGMASVASFFVSRVDVLVDKLLDEKVAAASEPGIKARLGALKGTAAIANAKLAYEIYERVFGEPQFAALRARGARPQRLLWASTGTKNPAYKDTYYAEALVGRETVDTLPPATLKAFYDHGVVAPALHSGLADAKRQLAEIAEAGVDMDAVMQKLLDDGVKLFADAFVTLMQGIESKRGAILARGTAEHVAIGEQYLKELIALKAGTRLWQRDATLWTQQADQIKVINNRLGWLGVADQMLTQADALIAFREEIESMGITDAVVLGMGGAALASDVINSVFGLREGGLLLHVLDTTDPATIAALEKRIDLRRTVFVVASKTGDALEVTSFYKYFRARMDSIENDTAGRHFVAITDADTSLHRLAAEENFGRVFLNPSDIGGRYSALSYFGLVPAVLQGLDARVLLTGAARMAQWCKNDSAANPGLWLGALLGGMALDGHDKLTLVLSPALYRFGLWLEEMVAESTGKQGRGIVPVCGDVQCADGALALKGGVAALSTDRLFVAITLKGDATHEKLITGVRKAGRPLIQIELEDVADLGAEFMRWEIATAFAGVVLGVNPFDEPNVADSRANSKRLLEAFEASGEFPTDASTRSANGQIGKFLRQAVAANGVRGGDYIALQAYLPYDEPVSDLLSKLRGVIRERVGVPVTLGYGPRFLHSTGQLHKGGANNVVVLQLTCDPAEELLIAGEPYSFGTVIRAQALGDLESMTALDRRVMRIHLGPDAAAGLRKVIRAISGGNRRPGAAK